MQVFVETHHYDGGFKSHLVPGPRRPDIVPPVDLVGLRSTEAELAGGDFALELSQFRRGSHHVCWLGCYTRGFDLRHGDRGTYCGIGIWLVDAALIHSLHLVAFLRDAAAKIANGSARFPLLHKKLDVFAEGFPDLGWCAPRNESAERWGAPVPMPGSCKLPSYLMLPDNQKESFDLAGIDILRQFSAKPGPESHFRRIYFLAPGSRIFARATEQLAYKSALTYAEHIIHSVGTTANSPAAARDGSLRAERFAAAV